MSTSFTSACITSLFGSDADERVLVGGRKSMQTLSKWGVMAWLGCRKGKGQWRLDGACGHLYGLGFIRVGRVYEKNYKDFDSFGFLLN